MTEPRRENVTLTCGCDEHGRCAQANGLWEAANGVYHSHGHDAWQEALASYRGHLAGEDEPNG